MSTSAGAVEQAVEGVNGIYASAVAGNIRAKHAAIKALAELAVRCAQMTGMLGRTMSEPGSNYGPEITEPVSNSGTHFTAAAMALGEADSALASLIHMTVGEVADSPRQAPHHSELNETGSGGSGGWVQRPWLSEKGNH